MRNHFEAKFILGTLLASLTAAPAALHNHNRRVGTEFLAGCNASKISGAERRCIRIFFCREFNSEPGKNAKGFRERTANGIAGSSSAGIAG